MVKEEGFTLIELLVVVAIIGILAAIAIPMFAEYKTRSFNSRALSDLKYAITAEEAYFVTNESYLSCGTSLPVPCEGYLPGLESLSPDVLLALVSNDGSPMMHISMAEGIQVLTGAACHPKGDSRFEFDSSSGEDASIIQRVVMSCSIAVEM